MKGRGYCQHCYWLQGCKLQTRS